MESIVLGGGCFWCTEAAFKELNGVRSVTSGYAGGQTEDPSYRKVCSRVTSHAEVIRADFEPEEISLEDLLKFFFRIHDPTTKDREGPDIGRQYRSIILYSSSRQRQIVEDFIEKKQEEYEDDIITEVKKLEEFYEAEERHQDYFEKNPEDAYCKLHVQPKIDKAQDYK